MRRIRATLDKLRCNKMAVACPDCKERLEAAGIETVSIYELMAPVFEAQPENRKVLTIHDPCKARSNAPMQEAVRTLIKKSGYRLAEPDNSRKKTKCCGRGAGGLVEYADTGWSEKYTAERCMELGGDFVTYCANCRETLRGGGLEGIHVLDLLFGDAEITKVKDSLTAKERMENQKKAKLLLQSM